MTSEAPCAYIEPHRGHYYRSRSRGAGEFFCPGYTDQEVQKIQHEAHIKMLNFMMEGYDLILAYHKESKGICLRCYTAHPCKTAQFALEAKQRGEGLRREG